MILRALLLVAAAALGGCVGEHELTNPARTPAELKDINEDPDIVEVRLAAVPSTSTFLPGKSADVWAYRDASVDGSLATIPGPLLRARKGNLVIVHFKNELPEPTTIHWHGLRLPAAMDGSTSTQSTIEPGAEFEYRFTVRDSGSFWFHPHVAAHEQIERGLYAPFIVEGGVAPEVAADRYFVLDDVKLDAEGKLVTDTDAMDEMMGRQGNVLLINGQRAPELVVSPGSRERWRFVNAANGRYFNLQLPGHRFLVIAWDGGVLPAPYEAERLLVAPGERYEVLVEFTGKSDERLALQNVHFDRGHHMPDEGVKDVLTLVFDEEARTPPAPLPQAWGTFEPIAVTAETKVRTFTLKETETPNGVTFSINDEVWPFNNPVMVKRNEVEIWEVRNEAEMDHPFHLHGMFFDVLSVNGVPPAHLGWKDTVNVPQKGTLRFAVKFEPLGMWMFHCHILEHAELGMMGDLMVME